MVLQLARHAHARTICTLQKYWKRFPLTLLCEGTSNVDQGSPCAVHLTLAVPPTSHCASRWSTTRETTIQHFKWSKRSVRASLLFMVAVSQPALLHNVMFCDAPRPSPPSPLFEKGADKVVGHSGTAPLAGFTSHLNHIYAALCSPSRAECGTLAPSLHVFPHTHDRPVLNRCRW